MQMGNVLISLSEGDEKLLRQLAEDKHQGKKGAISAVVAEAVQKLAQEDKYWQAVEHQRKVMARGYNLGLGTRKAYENRDELYDR